MRLLPPSKHVAPVSRSWASTLSCHNVVTGVAHLWTRPKNGARRSGLRLLKADCCRAVQASLRVACLGGAPRCSTGMAVSVCAGCFPVCGLHMACRFGRAMLRAIFDQTTRRDGHMCPEFLRSLRWWLTVLELGLAEVREWKQSASPPVHLFCDARGSPAHLGAVLFADGRCFWTHMAPPRSVVDRFRRRSDQQIMGLELLAISLGLCSFESLLRGRNVITHSDNKGSEVRATRICWFLRSVALATC